MYSDTTQGVISGLSSDGTFYFGFEDDLDGPNADNDYHDAIFKLNIPPSRFLDITPSNIGREVTVSDIDSNALSKATITITNPFAQDTLKLLSEISTGSNKAGDFIIQGNQILGTNITMKYENNTLTLEGNDSIANYEKVLQEVMFVNTGNNPTIGVRHIDFQVWDDRGEESGKDTVLVNVVNDGDTTIIRTPEDDNVINSTNLVIEQLDAEGHEKFDFSFDPIHVDENEAPYRIDFTEGDKIDLKDVTGVNSMNDLTISYDANTNHTTVTANANDFTFEIEGNVLVDLLDNTDGDITF